MLRSNLVATVVTLLLLVAQANANQALMKKLVHEYQNNTKSLLPSQGPCTPDNLVVRKEWYASTPSLALSPSLPHVNYALGAPSTPKPAYHTSTP